jgi:fermentation-respiration switch protein FrsA (DUF1100 family)
MQEVIFKITRKITVFIALSLPLLGCTKLIFQPDSFVYSRPKDLGLDFYDVFLRSADDIQIHGWFLRAKSTAKGTVFVLHGNAQNISSHVKSISWLPDAGYHVFIMDYRGYGDSTGKPSILGAVLDIKTGLTWLNKNSMVQKGPVFLLGQSLGAALGVYFVGNEPKVKQYLSGVVVDASFSSYRKIAQEKFSELWLTWLFQYQLSLLFTDKYDPVDYIAKLSPLPVLIMHSKEDRVVPFSHAQMLFDQAVSPKFFIETQGSHNDTFRFDQYRQDFLEFMDRATRIK